MKKDGAFGRIQEPSFNELSSQNVFNTASDLIAISYLERVQSQQNSTSKRWSEISVSSIIIMGAKVINLIIYR